VFEHLQEVSAKLWIAVLKAQTMHIVHILEKYSSGFDYKGGAAEHV